MRKAFKAVKIKERCFLYPLPVIKANKYLLEVPSEFSEVFILLFQANFLENPETNWKGWNKTEVHSDGKTPIYKLDAENLSLSLLTTPEEDPQKAKTINSLLEKKIKAILNGEVGAKESLKKVFENQKNCSTCQMLGITSSELEEVIDGLTTS
ncbi:MAG: hypothetical protein NXH75_07295 [Halobacteriovoraceae bacterium]|nr:hypothetical protein [Halobacteriovoraceae bacterium]